MYTILAFQISNYPAFHTKCNFLNDSKFLDSWDKLPQEDKAQCQALIDKGKLVAEPLHKMQLMWLVQHQDPWQLPL